MFNTDPGKFLQCKNTTRNNLTCEHGKIIITFVSISIIIETNIFMDITYLILALN